MGIDLSEDGRGYKDLLAHVGHDTVIVNYGEEDNVAIECETCGEVLVDFNKPKPVIQYLVHTDDGRSYVAWPVSLGMEEAKKRKGFLVEEVYYDGNLEEMPDESNYIVDFREGINNEQE